MGFITWTHHTTTLGEDAFWMFFPNHRVQAKRRSLLRLGYQGFFCFKAEFWMRFLWHFDTLTLWSWKKRNRNIFWRQHVFESSCWTDPGPFVSKSLSGWVLGFCWRFWVLLVELFESWEFFSFFSSNNITSIQKSLVPGKNVCPKTHTHNLQLLPTHPVPPAENTVFGTPQNVASKHRTSGGICMSRVFPKTAFPIFPHQINGFRPRDFSARLALWSWKRPIEQRQNFWKIWMLKLWLRCGPAYFFCSPHALFFFKENFSIYPPGN